MKRVLSIILTVTLVLSFSTFTVFANHGNGQGNGFGQGFGQSGMSDFRDMKGHWCDGAVQKIKSQGIIEGYSDGTFQPDKAITEAELAVILSRLLDKLGTDTEYSDSDTDDEDLSDVPSWARDSVKFGMNHNYFGHGRFHSQVQCNRLYAMVAIAKALDLDPVTDFEDNPFTDWGLMSKEDYGYILALYEEGYISGYPDGNFNPNNLITRAQIAKILEKLLEDGYADGTTSDDENAPTWDNDSEITTEEVLATSVELEWSGAEDDVKVVGYKVMYEVDDKDKVKYVTGKSAAISGLDEDTEYEFTVEAKDAAGNWSDDGPSVTVTTDEATEDSEDPTWDNDSTITATAIGTNYIDLKWSAADDDDRVASYKVIYKSDDETKTKYFTGNTGRISGLDEDTEYDITVEAKDAAGNLSDDGPSVTVTTLEEDAPDTAVPTWPSGSTLTVKLSATNTVTLTWPDANDNTRVTKYKIYKDNQLVKTVDGDANSYDISGLGSNTDYTFKVRAVDAAGNTSASLTATYLNE
jgi:chitodextrinase